MTHHDTSWHISFAGFASSQGRACTFHYWLLTSVSTNYETEDTHFQDTTLNARYGLHYEWHWIMLTTLSAHHWIVPLSLRTIYETPFLPTFTPYIIPWHSHYTHHPALPHIPHRDSNHTQLHDASLHTPSLTTQYSTSITLNTLSTAWLSDHTVPFFPTGLYTSLNTHTIFYFPSLHEYTIPHSITSFQYRWCPRLHTILYTACTHSSTSFQYSRYLTLYAWLSTHIAQDWLGVITHRVHRTDHRGEDTECSGLFQYMDTQSD